MQIVKNRPWNMLEEKLATDFPPRVWAPQPELVSPAPEPTPVCRADREERYLKTSFCERCSNRPCPFIQLRRCSR